MKFSTIPRDVFRFDWQNRFAAFSLAWVATILAPACAQAITLSVPIGPLSSISVKSFSPSGSVTEQPFSNIFFQLSGNIVVDYTDAGPFNSTLQFDSATLLQFANVNPPHAFAPGGTNAVMALNESVAGGFTNNIALRNLAISFQSGPLPLSFGGDGTFVGTISFPQGTADVSIPASISSTPLASTTPEAGASNKLSFFHSGNQTFLTMLMNFTVAIPNTDVTVQYAADIKVLVPEPSSLSLGAAASVLGAIGAWGGRFRKR